MKHYIMSLNIHRRDLTKSQKAWCHCGLATMTDGRVKKDLTGTLVPLTNESVAKQSGVSNKMIKQAKFIKQHAPYLGDAIMAKTKSVNEAYEIARKAKDVTK